jgi:hypothetical protein
MKNRAFAQPLFTQSAKQMEDLDTIRVESDGRTYAYALAGASALAVGKLTQTAVASDNAHNEALSASQSAAIGAMTLTMTFGGAITASFFKDGYLWVNDATGEGNMYRVADHPAGTADVVVSLKEPIRVALVASTSEVSLIQNRQALVVIAPTTLTGSPIGVPPIAVTAGYYFWNQVKGPAAMLTAGTAVIGNMVCPLTTAGAIAPCATTDVIGSVGTVLRVNATTEYSLVNLAIPGY